MTLPGYSSVHPRKIEKVHSLESTAPNWRKSSTMSKRYLYLAVLTGQGCASNKRGESSGNTSLLQHVFWNGLDHTAVSGCSIRFSLRLGIQYAEAKSVNRVFNEENLQWKYRED